MIINRRQSLFWFVFLFGKWSSTTTTSGLKFLTHPSIVQMSFCETAGNVENRRRLTLEPFLQAQLASEEVTDADNWGPPGNP